MNTFKRVFVGLTSSLLLAAGLSRAAERLDPLSQQLSTTDQALAVQNLGPSLPCTLPCHYVPRPTMVPPSQLG